MVMQKGALCRSSVLQTSASSTLKLEFGLKRRFGVESVDVGVGVGKGATRRASLAAAAATMRRIASASLAFCLGSAAAAALAASSARASVLSPVVACLTSSAGAQRGVDVSTPKSGSSPRMRISSVKKVHVSAVWPVLKQRLHVFSFCFGGCVSITAFTIALCIPQQRMSTSTHVDL